MNSKSHILKYTINHQQHNKDFNFERIQNFIKDRNDKIVH